MRKHPSDRAEKIKTRAKELDIDFHGDHSWAIAEASMIETPAGVTHLHWSNHAGHGKWVFTQRRSRICNTVRCRIVYITPLGHESETCKINQIALEEIQDIYHDIANFIDFPPSPYDINRRLERILGMTPYELVQQEIAVPV